MSLVTGGAVCSAIISDATPSGPVQPGTRTVTAHTGTAHKRQKRENTHTAPHVHTHTHTQHTRATRCAAAGAAALIREKPKRSGVSVGAVNMD